MLLPSSDLTTPLCHTPARWAKILDMKEETSEQKFLRLQRYIQGLVLKAYQILPARAVGDRTPSGSTPNAPVNSSMAWRGWTSHALSMSQDIVERNCFLT